MIISLTNRFDEAGTVDNFFKTGRIFKKIMQPYRRHASSPFEILVRDAQKHNVSLCAEIGRASAINAWSTAASIVMQKTGLVPARPDEVAENGARGRLSHPRDRTSSRIICLPDLFISISLFYFLSFPPTPLGEFVCLYFGAVFCLLFVSFCSGVRFGCINVVRVCYARDAPRVALISPIKEQLLEAFSESNDKKNMLTKGRIQTLTKPNTFSFVSVQFISHLLSKKNTKRWS